MFGLKWICSPWLSYPNHYDSWIFYCHLARTAKYSTPIKEHFWGFYLCHNFGRGYTSLDATLNSAKIIFSSSINPSSFRLARVKLVLCFGLLLFERFETVLAIFGPLLLVLKHATFSTALASTVEPRSATKNVRSDGSNSNLLTFR